MAASRKNKNYKLQYKDYHAGKKTVNARLIPATEQIAIPAMTSTKTIKKEKTHERSSS